MSEKTAFDEDTSDSPKGNDPDVAVAEGDDKLVNAEALEASKRDAAAEPISPDDPARDHCVFKEVRHESRGGSQQRRSEACL